MLKITIKELRLSLVVFSGGLAYISKADENNPAPSAQPFENKAHTG